MLLKKLKFLLEQNYILIFLNGFYNHIVKSNKYVQFVIVLWLISLMLYALTFFITFNETYLNMVVFAIRRFVFLLIFILTLITVQELPVVHNFKKDYETFEEGPSGKSTFLIFIRNYHISIIFLCYFSYFVAISSCITNPFLSTFFGILTLGFAALYWYQFVVYSIAFWKKPLDKSSSISFKNSSKKKSDSRGQIRIMVTGMGSNPWLRKLAVTCLECVKGGATALLVSGEMLYKLGAGGGVNSVSPPRQWVLNRMFLEDRTKIWTESKAAHALHNRAMNNPHDDIYKYLDMWK
uniref:Uncharacterized protein n=1 Tax=Amicula sp. isolate GU52X-4 cfCalB7 TaxID=3003489 RepID=A0A9E8YZL5_9STRA|nr:hypothetical protein [Amicula sp. isolate GU52X-4 cfCalB7]